MRQRPAPVPPPEIRRRLDRRPGGQPRAGHRRARALRHRCRDRPRRRKTAGDARPAHHGAPLQGLHRVQPLPLGLVAAVPGAAGPGLRQQRAWRARPLAEGPGLHPGAAARGAVVHGRGGDLLRHRHRLWRAAPARPLRQRHDRFVRPGAGRVVGNAARGGNGRPRHRPRCQPRTAGAGQGIRRLGDGQPAVERSGRGDQGSDPWRRRLHARHFEPARGAHRRDPQRQGLGHGVLCRRGQECDDRTSVPTCCANS